MPNFAATAAIALVWLAGCSTFLDSSQPQWFDESYARRRLIEITNPTDAPLGTFAVPLRVGSFGDAVTGPDGEGIVFADEADETIPFEIEQWNPTATSLIWVSVDLEPLATRRFFLYYDRDPPIDLGSSGGTFDGWEGVYHFAGELIESAIDSSPRGNHLTDLQNIGDGGDDDSVLGIFGPAVQFNPGLGEHIASEGVINAFSPPATGAVMYEVWFRIGSSGSDPYTIYDFEGFCGARLEIRGGELRARFAAAANETNCATSNREASSSIQVVNNDWHHAVQLIDRDGVGSNQRLYVDGVFRDDTNAASDLGLPGVGSFRIGRADDDGAPFDGEIDEVRISFPPPDADAWIDATYKLGVEDTDLVLIGGEERL